MPSAHPDPSRKPASAAQQRYLRTLARQTGTTFTPPRTSVEASAEIRRLKALEPDSARDISRERRQLQADLAERAGDGARVRPGEVTGYGANARWTHGAEAEDER